MLYIVEKIEANDISLQWRNLWSNPFYLTVDISTMIQEKYTDIKGIINSQSNKYK